MQCLKYSNFTLNSKVWWLNRGEEDEAAGRVVAGGVS